LSAEADLENIDYEKRKELEKILATDDMASLGRAMSRLSSTDLKIVTRYAIALGAKSKYVYSQVRIPEKRLYLETEFNVHAARLAKIIPGYIEAVASAVSRAIQTPKGHHAGVFSSREEAVYAKADDSKEPTSYIWLWVILAVSAAIAIGAGIFFYVRKQQ